tara:strand:- start:844 stop:1119 length:276 start_codon:yes stop_codon:yes gene_type:complete
MCEELITRGKKYVEVDVTDKIIKIALCSDCYEPFLKDNCWECKKPINGKRKYSFVDATNEIIKTVHCSECYGPFLNNLKDIEKELAKDVSK